MNSTLSGLRRKKKVRLIPRYEISPDLEAEKVVMIPPIQQRALHRHLGCLSVKSIFVDTVSFNLLRHSTQSQKPITAL